MDKLQFLVLIFFMFLYVCLGLRFVTGLGLGDRVTVLG